MRAAMWVALDLLADARTRRTFVWLTLPFLAWWPFQMGFIDGGAARSPLWASGFGFRHSLVMGAAWPAAAGLGLLAEVALSRKIAGGLEPLLAAPISKRGLVTAFALPTLALSVIWPLAAQPLAALGYRLGAGAWPGDGAGGFVTLLLSTLTAGVWLSASGVAALFTARSPGAFMLGSLGGYAALLALDLTRIALLLLGMSHGLVPLLLVALAAGAGALWGVSLFVEREWLLGGG